LISRPDVTAKLIAQTGGTPGYVAPEVLSGASPSPHSDLYSLGLVAYGLLAGTVRGRPLAAACPGLPHTICAAVERAIADDPAMRHESVAEFRAQLVGAPSDHDVVPLRLVGTG
jgi:serine/threonine protein kinase